jgi:DNA invertase Pin-like site-specific DNA recombinase
MNRAALYIRVSTDEQTVENQRPDREQLARARGYEIVEVFEEQESVAKRRPAFEAMMQGARRGRFTLVIIWALDRFGRSFVKNILDVKELDRLGVATVSVRETWLDTTSGLVRDILLGVFSAMAEHERTRLIERVHAGMQRAKAKGTKSGRPIGRPPASPVLLQAAAERVRAGEQARAVARALGLSDRTLRRFLGCATAAKPPPASFPLRPGAGGRDVRRAPRALPARAAHGGAKRADVAAELRRMAGLTPGDFAAVARRVDILGDACDAKVLVEEIAAELRAKETAPTQVGF